MKESQCRDPSLVSISHLRKEISLFQGSPFFVTDFLSHTLSRIGNQFGNPKRRVAYFVIKSKV